MPQRIVPLVFLALFLAACSGGSSPTEPEDSQEPDANLFLVVSLSDALSLPQDLTGVDVVLSPQAPGPDITAPLSIEGDRASGPVGYLDPGGHSLTINIRHGIPVLVRGAATHTVTEGVRDTLIVSELDLDHPFPELPRRILFVGNSLTSYNGGLGANMAGFAGETGPELAVYTFQQAPGGSTLERHWTDHDLSTRDIVADGVYDSVVLQGSPSNMVNESASYRTYAPLFIDLINGQGMQPALYIPPSYEDHPQYASHLVELCEDVTAGHPAVLIPINQTWYHVLENRPAIPLFHTDGTHPSVHGTYLNMCVIYAALFQMNPTGCTFEYDADISAANREYLQEAAWIVTSAYLGRED